MEGGTRRNWTRDETLALLSSYSRRIDEFQHSRKKKNAFKNVLEDLLSSGVLVTFSLISTKFPIYHCFFFHRSRKQLCP